MILLVLYHHVYISLGGGIYTDKHAKLGDERGITEVYYVVNKF